MWAYIFKPVYSSFSQTISNSWKMSCHLSWALLETVTKENILEWPLQLQHYFPFSWWGGYINSLLTVAIDKQWGCEQQKLRVSGCFCHHRCCSSVGAAAVQRAHCSSTSWDKPSLALSPVDFAWACLCSFWSFSIPNSSSHDVQESTGRSYCSY